MKIQTYTIVVGNEACDAKCPYCVSRMTGIEKQELGDINWRNFKIGCKFARSNGVSTVLLTGKGEPTLYPGVILDYVTECRKQGFPLIELQTNGNQLISEKYKKLGSLQEWYHAGMTTICLSIAHYNDEINNQIFQFKKTLEIKKVIDLLHEIGFSVRLSCVMLDGYIDDCEAVQSLVRYAKENEVEQLTVRPMTMPAESEDASVAEWTRRRLVSGNAIKDISDFLESAATEVMRLTHGAVVYDYDGQNICLSNCLTLNPSEKDTIRQLIFFPDGHLRYDWCYKGAILL